MTENILPSLPEETSMALNARIAALTAELAALKTQVSGTIPRHRQRDRLTDRKIQTLKLPGFYADGGNLYLDAWNLPSKNWVLRYSRNGRAHDYGLGTYPAVGLAAARLARDAALTKLRSGIDPVEERRAEKLAPKLERGRAMTFRQCAEAYIAAHEAGWRNAKHVRQWSQTLDAYVYPVFGSLPVQVVDTALVMKVVEPIWNTKTKTAARVRGRIAAILDWATAREYRSSGQPNPARWKGHLENLLPRKSKVAPTKNHEALPYAELPAFMAELAAHTGIGALALRFAILTAAHSTTRAMVAAAARFLCGYQRRDDERVAHADRAGDHTVCTVTGRVEHQPQARSGGSYHAGVRALPNGQGRERRAALSRSRRLDEPLPKTPPHCRAATY